MAPDDVRMNQLERVPSKLRKMKNILEFKISSNDKQLYNILQNFYVIIQILQNSIANLNKAWEVASDEAKSLEIRYNSQDPEDDTSAVTKLLENQSFFNHNFFWLLLTKENASPSRKQALLTHIVDFFAKVFCKGNAA